MRKLVRLVWALLAALGLLMIIVSFSPLVFWWGTLLAGPWSDPTGDVLIVLGGSTLDKHTLGISSYWRAEYAVLTYRQGEFHEVVVSGVDVAPLMRDFLVCQGVPAAVIRVEGASASTRENALYTAKLLAGVPGRKVLLTSDYHMFRARRAFTKAGLDVQPRPFPDARKSAQYWIARWPAFVSLVAETTKIGYYFVRGWI